MDKLTIREIYIGNILEVDVSISENKRGKKKRIFNFTQIKENAILLHVCEHGYIDIDNISNNFKYSSIKNYIFSDGNFHISEFILPDAYLSQPGKYRFVDKKSLQECITLNDDEELTYSMIKNLKKEIKEKRS